MLILDKAVGYLVRMLLQPINGTQFYCNNLDSCDEAISIFVDDYSCKVTAVANETRYEIQHGDDQRWHVTTSQDIELFRPLDKFHYSFVLPPFRYIGADNENSASISDIEPIRVNDKGQLFECSRGKPNRVCNAHVLCVESALKALHIGGYAATVLPKKWIGRDMSYMRWWNDNAAQVARIKLPLSSVKFVTPIEEGGEEKSVETQFELCIWQRPGIPSGGDRSDVPNSGGSFGLVQFAEFRYSPFMFSMDSLSETSVEKCGRAFRKHEWWGSSVNLYRKMLEKNPMHAVYGTYKTKAADLPNPKETYYLSQKPEKAAKVSIVKSVDEIRDMPLAVHIKPGPPIKLAGYNVQSMCRLHDIKVGEGTRSEEGEIVFNLTEELSREMYSSIADKILKLCLEAGLVPCMLEQDVARIQRQQRWLSIQLTPIERIVLVNGAEDNTGNWETIFEDVGMYATHPEVMALWRQRAKKMKLDMISYDFQFEDILYGAAKQSLVVSNVMGLGKTRETLMIALLRGVRHCLLIVPAKLIGVWQQEIETTLASFVRIQRKDWRGVPLSADYQVIEYAEQCLPHNLRRFNIISYDKLKSKPRDGKAFRCPKCGTISFKRFERNHDSPQKIPCPGNFGVPEDQRCSHVIVNWQNRCKKDGLRKYKVSLSSGKKIHWSNPHAETCKIVDDRPEKPTVQLMEPVDFIPRKVKRVVISYEANAKTGERTPVYAERERKPHVAWTFADLLRWRFNLIAADEALYFKNYKANRTAAMHHICARNRISLTGTPVKGHPQAILSILNWTLKKSAFPLYRGYDKRGESRFLAKYKTVVKVNTENGAGGSEKQVPRINNPELFQSEIAPFLRRNTRNQPNVLKDIPKKEQTMEVFKLDMDDQHKEYYNQWLKKFAEWWATMKEETEGKKKARGELITKIGYLINASTIPHFMLDNITKSKDAEMAKWAMMIGPYKGPVHAKMRKIFSIVQENAARGEKTIVFSTRRKNLDLGMTWAQRNGLHGMIVDGSVSLTINPATNRSPRQEAVDKFRNYDYNVMWAGLGALAEGLNIPEANNGLFLDYSWNFVDWKQAIGRMIRPQQTRTVNGAFCIHHGTIDEYMGALCFLKEKSVDESIDFMEFDDFSVEIIPDIHQYADAIVDGTEHVLKRKMWLAVEHIRKQSEEGEDEEGGDDENGDD